MADGHPWNLRYEGYDPEAESLREALCTLGNGYFATRGALAEHDADGRHYPGTYVAGLYDRLTTDIDGHEVENEDLVNVPNWIGLRFRRPGGAWLSTDEHVVDHHVDLDVRRAVLTRISTFEDSDGHRTRVSQRRIVHMGRPHLAAIQTTFVPENWDGSLEVQSTIDGTVVNAGVARYRQLASDHLEPLDTNTPADDTISMVVRTRQSKVRVAVAARTRQVSPTPEHDVTPKVDVRPGLIAQSLTLALERGRATTIDKIVTIFTSRDRGISAPLLEAETWVTRAEDFDALLGSHIEAWDQLWQRFRLETEVGPDEQLALNLHIFHLLQTVSKHTIDLDVGVPARGWHGEAYRGHVFWDELFIFPFLNLHLPDLTRSLLLYRYRRLGEARWNARSQDLAGALYPWQSGSDGREESQTLHLNPKSGRWLPDNSRLQRHVNHAIAYNTWSYHQTTGDLDFLAFYGAEMLVEISRMLVSLTSYNRSLDRYEILGVMGPDEYHDAYPDSDEPGLDNNSYTNVMTVWVLRRALEALDLVPDYRRTELWDKLRLNREELDGWDAITHKMRIVFHDGVLSQFEGYDELEEFDWVGYAERYGDIQRLDRILEAEGDTPNRYKVSKQADVVMLFYLLSRDELAELFEGLGYAFDDELMTRTIEYYDSRTSHGSTLSRIVHSWVLARIDRRRSWELFRSALMSDIADIQGGTTAEGIHLGAMAGTVDLVQRGYTGLEIREDQLQLDPAIPPELRRLDCHLRFRGQWIDLSVTTDSVTISTDPGSGDRVVVDLRGEVLDLRPGSTEMVPIAAPA